MAAADISSSSDTSSCMLDIITTSVQAFSTALIPLTACMLGLILLWLNERSRKHGHRIKPLPPGPINLPVIGAFLSVGFTKHHLKFYKLGKRYGPLVYMKLRGAGVVSVNTAETAMELLKIHDAEFCDRAPHMAGEHLGFGYLGLDFCPYNAHFRKVRKVINSELLSQPKLKENAYIRREELFSLVAVIEYVGRGGACFNLRSHLDDTITNIMGRMMFGRLYTSNPKVIEAIRELKIARLDTVELEKVINIADMIPQLARFDLQGIEAKFIEMAKTFGSLYEKIVKEHRWSTPPSPSDKDFIDFLLDYNEGGDTFSENAITSLLNDMMPGGIDTVAMSVEWALAALLQNPQKLLKAQQEIDAIVGNDRPLEESDLDNLPYLMAIVKETLRLYPVVFLTLPHFNEREAELLGYRIPARTRVHVNLYAIARDPAHWQNAEEFLPERFLGSNLTFSGNNFQFLPFSSGRRRCPAVQLGSIQVAYTLGTLLHAFEWSLPPHMHPKDIIMEGRHGIANDKLQPLIVRATAKSAAKTNYQLSH